MSASDHNLGHAPNSEQLLTSVVDVVVRTLDDPRVDIGSETALLSSVERFDSFRLMELVLQLEKRFGLSIPDEDLDRDTFSSPRTIAAYLHRRLWPRTPD
ncbi:MAG TPA: phosphopantetheine-binding protein [Vicinamibacterales bacterium]|nr:phosphopantetheine-binding protein [Vicinamibacterales bacterium]